MEGGQGMRAGALGLHAGAFVRSCCTVLAAALRPLKDTDPVGLAPRTHPENARQLTAPCRGSHRCCLTWLAAARCPATNSTRP